MELNLKSIKLIAILMLSFFAINAIAQEPFYRKNLTNFKSDALNQNQILQLQQQVSTSKMTELELTTYLLGKGMTLDEINKLRLRMSKQNSNAYTSKALDLTLMGLNNELDTSENNLLTAKNYLNSKEIDYSLIFGSSLFTNGKLGFINELQLATPEKYVIGPGDNLNVTMYGYQESNLEIKVLPNGKINIPYAGLISIGGLTIDQATQKITQTLTSSGYASLATGKTKLQLTVAQYRTFPVTVIGAKAAGTYMVSSVANAFHVLHMAAGPDKRGTYREIEHIRKGKIIQTIDLYSFLMEGNQQQFLNLQENDIINIPSYDRRVTIKGEAKNIGFFELKPTETLTKLLQYAGGFTPNAFKERVYIEQVSNNEFVSRDIREAAYSKYEPLNGDIVYIGSIMNRYSQRISVSGSIKRPGYYGWEKQLKLSQLIQHAGGLKESAMMNRGLVYRSGHDLEQSYLHFSPMDVIQGKSDILLNEGDSVIIADKSIFNPIQLITVSGMVNAPGKFPYANKMTLADALLLAGGLNSLAYPTLEVIRKVESSTENQISKVFKISTEKGIVTELNDFTLYPQDIVVVRQDPTNVLPQSIELTGQFVFPGTYALVKPYETLLEVLNRSGGLNNYANKDYINIIRKKPLEASSKLKKISKEIQKKQRIDDPLSTQTFNDDLKDLEDTSSNNQRDEMNVVPMDTISVNLKLLYDAKAGNKYDINLLSGDILNAIPVNNTVRVSGQVNKEVIINYFGDNLKGYIDEAGGFSSTADKKSVYVLEVDQSSKSTKSFLWFRNYPRVSPGSMVIVPSKPLELNKANDNGRLMSMSSLLASTSGIILALLTFLKK